MFKNQAVGPKDVRFVHEGPRGGRWRGRTGVCAWRVVNDGSVRYDGVAATRVVALEGRVRRLMVLLGGLLVADMSVASESYRVGKRDELHVEVYGEEDCTRNVTVSESGTITLPHIGEVDVGGLTLEEATRAVSDHYRRGILVNPEVTVTVRAYLSQPYQVVGAVKQPGVFYLERPISVREALSRAGWIDAEKSSRQVTVRRGDERIVFSVDALSGTRGDLVVRTGDVISVDEGQWVYVSGHVQNEGEIVYHDGLTVFRALTKAGGPADTARLRRAYLVREDGERIQVNLKRIRDSKDPDVLMQPGDRLVVHESPL